jgi:hypothetical protein
MSKSNVVRIGLMGSAAALALAVSAPGAQAVEYTFGDVQIVFDTTVSAGASMRVADRNRDFLSESNGGSRIDTRFVGGFIPSAPLTGLGGLTAGTITLNSLPSGTNREGSVNGDDGRLNYDSGDLTGANVKANHDLQISWQNFKIFVRGVEFYDVILSDGGHTNRSDLSENVTDVVGRDAQLLDAFISADFTLGELPLNVRAGKQVISWGEGTFILNGLNVPNPIDVNAFRRPGAEIKEGLLPVNSLYMSLGLPIEGTSISAYYMLDWEPFKIDQPGTPFSGADVFGSSNLLNEDPNGNIFGRSFLSGGKYAGSFRRNCNTPTTIANPGIPGFPFPFVNTATNGSSPVRQIAGNIGLGAAYDAAIHNRCAVGADPIDYTFAIPTGQLEFIKNTFGDENIVGHQGAREARDDGQYGLRFNWYSDGLGGTEFGFYYQNYHSRLPYVGFHAGTPTLGISTTSQISSGSSRPVSPLGVLYSAASNPAVLLGGAAIAPNGYVITGNPNVMYGGLGTERAIFQDTFMADPNNWEALMAPIAGAIAQIAAAGTAAQSAAAAAPGPGQNLPLAAQLAAIAAAQNAEAASMVTRATTNGANQADFDNLGRINAWLTLASFSTGVGGTPFMMDGAETLTAVNNMDVYFQYPEDIQMWGMSFNTVIAGWGVQGEFTYRQNAPFQLDTDQLTIASAFTQCASAGVGTSGQAFQLIQTLKQYNCPYNDDLTQTAAQKRALGINPGNQDLQGYITNQMYTASIGTTATFTQSDWFIDAVGADLGILVTELGMVLVPGVEDTYISKVGATAAGPQYQNTGCQGTDLPLGGFLDLRAAKSKQCRPSDFSTGLVLLYRLEYNNAFDTGFSLAPQLTYSWDIEGTTPAPYGNFVQDRQAISLGVTGTLNNNFRVGASYVNFFSGHVQSKARDQDFASVTASYTF